MMGLYSSVEVDNKKWRPAHGASLHFYPPILTIANRLIGPLAIII